MQRVRAYVDGFNLYHGIHSRYGRVFHWLDLEVLVRRLLRRGQRLELVRYLTAHVRGNDESRLRQLTYLDALSANCPRLEIIEGRFQQKTCACFSCGARWTAYEEKESDVSLAVALVEDAALGLADVALVLSADLPGHSGRSAGTTRHPDHWGLPAPGGTPRNWRSPSTTCCGLIGRCCSARSCR